MTHQFLLFTITQWIDIRSPVPFQGGTATWSRGKANDVVQGATDCAELPGRACSSVRLIRLGRDIDLRATRANS